MGLLRNIKETAIWGKQTMAIAVGKSKTMKRKVEKGQVERDCFVLNKPVARGEKKEFDLNFP